MRDDQEFNITFVLVVEKYDVLYNYKLQTYFNRNLKKAAWQKVASEVKCTAEECKKRWRLLRISLLRHLRENEKQSCSSAKKKKTFYLEDAMKYLIPYTKSRRQTGTVTFDEDEICENDSQLDDSQTVIHIEKEDEDENEKSQEINRPCSSDFYGSNKVSSMSTDVSKATSLSPKKRKFQSTENWDNAAVQCLPALGNKYNIDTKKKKESSEEEDSDLMFLKSLLPDLKKLSDAQKRRFKQRIFVLYEEILNEDFARCKVHAPISSPYSSTVSVSSDDNSH